MSLLSLFQKKSSASQTDDGNFQSRSAEDSVDSRDTSNRTKRKSSRQTTEPIDPMLPEKKRARRRLVGAVALVLTAVIGLPLVLDAEQKPLDDDVVIQIPSKDQPSPSNSNSGVAAGASKSGAANASKNSDKNPAKNSATNSDVRLAPSTTLSPSEEVITIPATAASSESAGGDKANASAANTAAAVTAPPKPRPEPTPPPKSAKATPPKDAGSTREPVSVTSDAARAQSILNGAERSSPDSATKSEKKNMKVVIQVAALASKDKVSELQDKLKAAGISSYTQTVATEAGPRIRIRIGPLNSKEEADTVRSKLTKIGLNGTLVPS